MTKLPFALILALVPAAAFAAPANVQHLSRDGMIFDYTVQQRGKLQVIDGTEQTSGRHFHYVVEGTHVSGTNGDMPVDFEAEPQADQQIASR